MHGVRIKLPEYPFKIYHFKKGEFFLDKDISTHIDIANIYSENKCSITPDCPVLVMIEYDNSNDKIYPIVRKESYPGALQDFLKVKSLDELKRQNINVSYSFKEIGNYKRKNWEFQKEWRYKISIAPMGLQESNPPSLAKQQEYCRRLEDRITAPPYQRIFLNMDENALRKMEVVFGPRMTDAEKIMAVALLKKYVPECKYRNSCLKIK